MEFLKKIQNQPESVRKMILWAVLIVIGIILFVFWVLHSVRSVDKLSKTNILEEMNVPNFEADVGKSMDDIKQKVDDVESIKQKAEDILNDEELEKLIEEKINEE